MDRSCSHSTTQSAYAQVYDIGRGKGKQDDAGNKILFTLGRYTISTYRLGNTVRRSYQFVDYKYLNTEGITKRGAEHKLPENTEGPIYAPHRGYKYRCLVSRLHRGITHSNTPSQTDTTSPAPNAPKMDTSPDASHM
jgi:hypothetical protein